MIVYLPTHRCLPGLFFQQKMSQSFHSHHVPYFSFSGQFSNFKSEGAVDYWRFAIFEDILPPSLRVLNDIRKVLTRQALMIGRRAGTSWKDMRGTPLTFETFIIMNDEQLIKVGSHVALGTHTLYTVISEMHSPVKLSRNLFHNTVLYLSCDSLRLLSGDGRIKAIDSEEAFQ